VVPRGLNSCCNIPGSVSKAILRRAGSEMQLECTNNPVLQSKHIRVTKGWNLFCENVIHVETPRSVDKLAERIKEALDDAELIGVTSVALPTLGAGLLNKINFHFFIPPEYYTGLLFSRWDWTELGGCCWSDEESLPSFFRKCTCSSQDH